MAAAQAISLDLVISLSVEQNFPSFLKAQHSQSVCHFGIQLLPKQHIPLPQTRFTFCSLLLLQDLFSSLLCQEMVQARLIEPLW